jgi:hypothetical protein
MKKFSIEKNLPDAGNLLPEEPTSLFLKHPVECIIT